MSGTTFAERAQTIMDRCDTLAAFTTEEGRITRLYGTPALTAARDQVAEWMTLAANVLSVPSNWSGGSVGSGYIYSGHNDNDPPNPIQLPLCLSTLVPAQ